MERFSWQSARSIPQAAALATTTVADAMLADATADNVILKAGGIDVLDLMKEGLLRPSRLVNLREIPGLDAIAEDDAGIRIGAMATLQQIASHPVLRLRYTALADAAGSSANPQIRNVATLGGNLLQRPRCWYFRSAAHYCARKGGEEVDVSAGEWILNPGSVGQPRDGDARAAWLLLDTGAWTAHWQRTPYDIAGAAAAIRAARLPDSLAERLEYGQ